MKNKILETIKEYNMIKKGDTVAVCLSGGADSMSLFHFLCENREEFEIKLIAIHINHGLRKESDSEEEFILNYAKKYKVEVFNYKAFMNEDIKPYRLSTETWARKIRYDYFEKIQRETNCKLLTAHTASDNLETVIFNLTRGTNIKGLKGISVKRDDIYRPLIKVTRKEVENYCEENNVPYVNDNTNFLDIYSRNKIRLKVVPHLKEINSKIEDNIFTFTKEMEDINTFLTKLSDNLYSKAKCENGFNVNEILKEDKVVIKTFLRNILEENDSLTALNIENIYNSLNKKSYKKQLREDLFCYIENERLFFKKPIKNIKENIELNLKFNESIDFFSKKITFFICEHKNLEKNNKNPFIYYIDYDKILNEPKLRNRKTNDNFTFSKRDVTKSLKKLFIEDKIEKELRDKLLVLADGDNVVFLEKYGVNKLYEISNDTKTVLVLQIN